MSDSDAYVLDKHRLRRSFNAAADSYDDAAVLQQEVAGRLLERLDLIRLQPELILDLGAGTGGPGRALCRRYRNARVISVDLAERMLQRARRKRGWFRKQDFVCTDMEQLPLRDRCVDLVFSSLSFQWVQDFDRLFREIKRVLRPGGLLLFSTFGPDTLMELRRAWATAENRHVHVNAFMDMHDLGDAMARSALADPVMDMEHIVLTYSDAVSLMKDIKAIGAHNITSGRNRGLTGRGTLQRVTHAYEQYRRDGLLPATYEVIYGHGWGSDRPAGQRNEDGSVSVPISAIGRRGRTHNEDS